MDHCYRHPDRETGVACSRCERPICPDCMTTTSVGMRCPECAADRIEVRSGAAALGGDPSLTYALIALNVIVFLATTLSGGSATGGSFGASDLLTDGAVSRHAVADGEIWRVVTAGFLHAGLFHLAFNMFALWILGGLLEPAIGRLRFALLYAVSVLGGSFGALLLEPDALTVGASGGIFGLMAAAIIVMRSRGIDPMESGLGLWMGLNLLITFTVPGISIGGHLGGLVGGGAAALILFELGERSRGLPAAVPALLVGALCGLAVVGSVVVSGSS
ncbi:MAG TPA: rhomboid family intramembrane serine protease [Thermoleophilaceae bacterium]|nr:rhomboid family intramembrane serine protease [Thermoleophilaceae bacterium]